MDDVLYEGFCLCPVGNVISTLDGVQSRRKDQQYCGGCKQSCINSTVWRDIFVLTASLLVLKVRIFENEVDPDFCGF